MVKLSVAMLTCDRGGRRETRTRGTCGEWDVSSERAHEGSQGEEGRLTRERPGAGRHDSAQCTHLDHKRHIEAEVRHLVVTGVVLVVDLPVLVLLGVALEAHVKLVCLAALLLGPGDEAVEVLIVEVGGRSHELVDAALDAETQVGNGLTIRVEAGSLHHGHGILLELSDVGLEGGHEHGDLVVLLDVELGQVPVELHEVLIP